MIRKPFLHAGILLFILIAVLVFLSVSIRFTAAFDACVNFNKPLENVCTPEHLEQVALATGYDFCKKNGGGIACWDFYPFED